MATTPEPAPPSEDPTAQRRLDMALDARRFEIGLFWQRSLFFWGFNAAALVASGTAATSGRPEFSMLIRCFGFICALVWALANRGSKYWHEAWEAKVHREELNVVGPLYSQAEPLDRKGFWLSARRYSVSRLAMALADYMVFVWLVLLANQVMVALEFPGLGWLQKAAPFCVLAFTLFYAGAVVVSGRSGKGETESS